MTNFFILFAHLSTKHEKWREWMREPFPLLFGSQVEKQRKKVFCRIVLSTSVQFRVISQHTTHNAFDDVDIIL